MTHEAFADANSADNRTEYNWHLQSTRYPLPPHRKVVLYYSPVENDIVRGDSEPETHGTHTAGTLAGDKPAGTGTPASYGTREDLDGMAPAARLAICDIYRSGAGHVEILGDYSNYWSPALRVSANVSSNSWGDDNTTALYTTIARQHDSFAWENRQFLIVRSMGNKPSPTQGVIMAAEAVAKNVVSVGATENKPGPTNTKCLNPAGLDEKIWEGSKIGPTADGRTKPNVVAPGALVESAWFQAVNRFTAYHVDCGTSMSAPLVAGSAALVRDYFAKGFYPSGAANPADARPQVSAALVRALLQVSTKEILLDDGNPAYPNGVQGWGRVRLDDGLYFTGDRLRLLIVDEATALTTGGTEVHRFRVRDSHDPLRVMLAWTDRPGAAGALPAIVNDLDLRLNITLPTGQNVFYTGNAWEPGTNQTRTGEFAPDAINVEEAVFRNTPTPGVYTARVRATNVPIGAQSYALAIVGDVEWA